MNLPLELAGELPLFPTPLQELVEAELRAGNTIAELGHGFPAAPCGAYVKLARPVSSRPREKTTGLDFYDRNCTGYSGEFTDAKRHFFVLEPPHPVAAEPDMNAIRAKLQPHYSSANLTIQSPNPSSGFESYRSRLNRANGIQPNEDPASLIARFRASMKIDYEKWHDGVGYDIDLIKQASPEEAIAIEELVLQRRVEDWRDIEALAALGTSRAKEALQRAYLTGNSQVRTAVRSHAPELLTGKERVASLVQTLHHANFYGGLTQALDEVASFHPEEVIDALLRGLIDRNGDAACHFAAMLFYIHGQANSVFDWEQRPFFLRFNTNDPTRRRTAARELCQTLNLDPARCRLSKNE